MISGERQPLHLDSGDPGESRAQALIWDPEVEAWLRQIDVEDGWQCVDLGCGSLGILEPLSRHSAPTGRVIGVEPRPILQQAAAEFVRRSRLINVRLLDTPLHDTSLPDSSFQLVHARFVLSAGYDASRILGEMLRLVRPGGIVAVEEPDPSAWSCYPDHPAWARLRDALRAAFAAAGADLDAGSGTFALLRDAGLQDVRIRPAAIALQGAHPQKGLLVDLARLHRQRIVETGSLSGPELDEALAACGRIAADPETVVVSFLVTQVWGRRAKRR